MTCFGLIYGQLGTLVTQATLSAIAYTVTRINGDNSQTVTGAGTFAVAATVYDTPVTADPRYVLSGGYNFAGTVPHAAFTRGLKHTIDIDFTPVSGEPFRQVYEGVPL